MINAGLNTFVFLLLSLGLKLNTKIGFKHQQYLAYTSQMLVYLLVSDEALIGQGTEKEPYIWTKISSGLSGNYSFE